MFKVSDCKYESRVVTKSGVSLLPSNQKGVGRKYNKKEYLKRRRLIDRYVFTSVVNSPTLRVVMLSESDVPQTKSLNLNPALASFGFSTQFSELFI